MQLQLRDFASLVANAAAAVQAASRALVDLSVGSTLRAILEANASIGLWMQWLILRVSRMTRAATSDGEDLDSWVGDFDLARLPAVAATGQARFARFTATEAALVPAGTLVRTADAKQGFVVQADAAHPAWDAARGGYALAAGVASVTVPIAAEAPGAAGNVQPGAIALIADALPGVDTVANDLPLVGGLDAESDAALRARFRDFLASRSRATPVAVGHAVASLRQGLRWHIAENAADGSFVVTVDDGSGAPPSDLLSQAASAIDAVRPVATSFAVQPPAVSTANVSMLLEVEQGAAAPEVAARVAVAITEHLASLPVGGVLRFTRLAQLAYDASPAVANVSAVSLNGGTADLDPGPAGVVRPGAVVVG
jgi:uncharacterized phage protein gp47/JayE